MTATPTTAAAPPPTIVNPAAHPPRVTAHLPALISLGQVAAPKVPGNIHDTGLEPALLHDLTLKLAHSVATFTTEWASQCLRLPIQWTESGDPEHPWRAPVQGAGLGDSLERLPVRGHVYTGGRRQSGGRLRRLAVRLAAVKARLESAPYSWPFRTAAGLDSVAPEPLNPPPGHRAGCDPRAVALPVRVSRPWDSAAGRRNPH